MSKSKRMLCSPRKSVKAYDLNVLSDSTRARYEKLPDDIAQASFLVGAGSKARPAWDVPAFNVMAGSEVVLGGPKQQAGNAWIVMGLDRTSFAGSGWGGQQASHCAAIDIVVGRGGWCAASHEANGTPIVIDPSFIDDAARLYLSQRCGVDGAFSLPKGKVGNITFDDPRSAAVIKADAVRLVARENIKFVTRTDSVNSQGGVVGNSMTAGYGIDLIACEDEATLQPMVKGNNLVACLSSTADFISATMSILNTYVNETRKLHQRLLPHDHHSPFYGNKTAPDFSGIIPEGINVMINNVTNTDVGIQQIQAALLTHRQTYLLSTGVEVLDDNGNSLNILSPYNSNN
jgi:hypothetical protein